MLGLPYALLSLYSSMGYFYDVCSFYDVDTFLLSATRQCLRQFHRPATHRATRNAPTLRIISRSKRLKTRTFHDNRAIPTTDTPFMHQMTKVILRPRRHILPKYHFFDFDVDIIENEYVSFSPLSFSVRKVIMQFGRNMNGVFGL